MLLTDGGIITPLDLERYESSIQGIANANAIDLDKKITQALAEIRVELQSHLQRASAIADPTRVVGQYFGSDAAATRIRSEQIVVTGALSLWLAYRALELFFRDAWARKANDKYQQKYLNYQEDRKKARDWFFDEGVAIVFRPLPRPGAPALAAVAGGSLAQRTYVVQVTWQDAAGSQSGPSALVSLQVQASQLARVDIAALAPPAGATLEGGQTPVTLGTATGWNVYAAAAGQAPTRQTSTAIALATTTWTEPVTGLTSSGAPVGSGQEPDVFRSVQNTLMRG